MGNHMAELLGSARRGGMKRTTPPERAPAQLRQATFADYAQISSLGSRYGLQFRSYEEWRHLWVNNPTYKSLPEWPIGWVVENEHKDVVGHIGNVPLAYEFQGRNIVAATGRGFVVDLCYRGYSLLLFAEFLKQRSLDLVINTTVNPEAARLHELFRCSRVPVGAWDTAVFWITDYRNFISTVAALKSLPLPNLWNYPLSVVLFVKDAFSRRALRTYGADRNRFQVSFCTNFDDRFDAFWDELRTDHSHLLLANRSCETLAWHFKFALEQSRLWIVTIVHGSKLVAYAIFSRQDISGLHRVRLVDFQTTQQNSELLIPVLSLVWERCRSEGIHVLEVVGLRPEKQRVIASIAPYSRKRTYWPYFYKAKDKQLAWKLRDPGAWDPSMLDGDVTL